MRLGIDLIKFCTILKRMKNEPKNLPTKHAKLKLAEQSEIIRDLEEKLQKAIDNIYELHAVKVLSKPEKD